MCDNCGWKNQTLASKSEVKIGIDYWQVLSHYPEYFCELVRLHMQAAHEVHIVSAIGKNRIGTIEKEVRAVLDASPYADFYPYVHEVVFNDPSESPQLKLAKCQELGLTVFYDDREDVCRLLNKNGILAMRVTRRDNSTYDLGAERQG